MIEVVTQLISQENVLTFLKNGLRLPHLFEVLMHLGGKADVIKALVQNPKILDEVLNATTEDAKRLIDALGQSISHFGSLADGARVIEAAIDAKVDLVSLGRLLNLASNNSGTARWNDSNAIVYFFTHIADAINSLTATPMPNVPIPTWSGAVDALDTFNTVHVGSIKYESGSISDAVRSIRLSLPNGSTIQINITEERLFHFLNRHTYEEFALAPRRSFTQNSFPVSSLWPPGYTRDQILQDAQNALQDSGTTSAIQTAISNGKQSLNITIPSGVWQYRTIVEFPGTTNSDYRLVQIYPANGMKLYRNVLRGIADVLAK